MQEQSVISSNGNSHNHRKEAGIKYDGNSFLEHGLIIQD
jgi:hypothetical protein